MKKQIIIAGGSGFIGTILTKSFVAQGYKVKILTRGSSRKENAIQYIHWDAKSIGDWKHELEDTEILINLTGKSVDCRYTDANKKAILNSRIDATRILGKVVEQLKNPPELWFNSSTATIYEFSLKQPMSERTGKIGNDFSMSVAKAWEKAFYESDTPNTRKIALRISLVLGGNGGVVPVLKRLVKFGLGGKQGNGQQKFAWIHQADIVSIVDFCVRNKNIKGAVNCVSESDINNQEFMKAFRKVLNVKLGIPTPTFMVHIGSFFMRTEPELILKSRYVIPEKLLENGFEFKYNDINLALEEILKK